LNINAAMKNKGAESENRTDMVKIAGIAQESRNVEEIDATTTCRADGGPEQPVAVRPREHD